MIFVGNHIFVMNLEIHNIGFRTGDHSVNYSLNFGLLESLVLKGITDQILDLAFIRHKENSV
jgi:hypothetical protein